MKNRKAPHDHLRIEFLDDGNILEIIAAVRSGIGYTVFLGLVQNSPFTVTEWSHYLHLSERTLQRYNKERRSFDPIHSEKILEIAILYKKGIEVFGEREKFDTWLSAKNVGMGGRRPKDLLDNTFGIRMVRDELIRIEFGVLA